MTKKVFNMQGGLHSAAAFTAFENAAWGSCVANAGSFTVSAGTGMNVQIAAGDGIISTQNSGKRIQTDAVETAAVAAASPSYSRIDTVVAYIDNAVVPTTSVVDNTNGVLKFACVAGTAAATPLAPSGAAIQAAIGAGNSYMVLYNVTVPSNATNLTAATFTDLRKVITVIDGSQIKPSSIPAGSHADGSIKPSDLSSTAGNSWAWQAWTPTLSGFASMTWTGTPSVAKFTRIGNTVFFVFQCKGTAAGTASNAVRITAPMQRKDTTEDVDCGSGHINNDYSYGVKVRWEGTSKTNILIERDSNHGNFVGGGLYVYITGFYEV